MKTRESDIAYIVSECSCIIQLFAFGHNRRQTSLVCIFIYAVDSMHFNMNSFVVLGHNATITSMRSVLRPVTHRWPSTYTWKSSWTELWSQWRVIDWKYLASRRRACDRPWLRTQNGTKGKQRRKMVANVIKNNRKSKMKKKVRSSNRHEKKRFRKCGHVYKKTVTRSRETLQKTN